MKKLWVIQVVCATLIAAASWSLTPLMLLALAEKGEPITYGHVVFCVMFLIVMLLSFRVVYELSQERE